jgi:hypothetical protein
MRGEVPAEAAGVQAVTRLGATLACSLAFAGAALAATPVKVLQTWQGHMPLAVPPLLQSSVSSQQQWKSVWATCQMQGAAPAIDFDKHLVLIAVRQSSVVSYQSVKLDNGNLVTTVVATPDKPNRMTCALALVPRAGVAKVNGALPGF